MVINAAFFDETDSDPYIGFDMPWVAEYADF
ncbi:hypothetical protein IL54_1683 [Sphingobium sp. ba1]|nr:hypothetical protein IL54_1683 [Sphingobium sp. ba1]